MTKTKNVPCKPTSAATKKIAKVGVPISKANPASPRKATKPSPSKVRFELTAPGAGQVFLAGTFNQWESSATPMTRTREGKWVKELALGPGAYEYLFLVDGKWLLDPGASERVPNPFGGSNGLLQVA
jgi:1,4-alpha-glucan branching enzyme